METLASYLTHTLRSKWTSFTFVVAVVLGAAICCSGAFAQTQSGLSTIQGTVTDSTGAVIRGATIHIVNNATAAATTAKSNDVGFYQAPGLVTGTYTVTVEAPGMKTNVYTLKLLATQTAVVNPVMAPGEVTQQITVVGSIVQLTDTADGSITTTLENEQINHIPMNGRNISFLTWYTTPGLEPGLGGGGTRMNDLSSEALEYVEDGAPTLNRDFGGPNSTSQAQYTDADSVQEVRVEASGGGAQYATPGTAIITTKSGTNGLHGTGFWTGRNNSAAGVAKVRQNPANFAVPNLKRNEFGISAGGPIVIPGLYHGKDKSFWFFGFERFSYIYSTNQFGSTETTGMRTGDFSGLTTEQLYDPATTHNDPACPTPKVMNGATVWNAGTPAANPYCRMPFGDGVVNPSTPDPLNNQIPATRLNKLAKVVYDGQIPPNISGVTNPRLQPNENWAAPNFQIIPTITWRLDHNFNENNKAYLRYTQNKQNWQYYGGSLGTIAADGIPALAFGSETIAPFANYVAAAGYTHVFSPSFFSETILSGNWSNDIGGNTGDMNRNYEAELGVPNAWGEPGMPAFNGSIQGHNGGQFGYGISDTVHNLDENLTKTLSKHQVLFGARFRHEFLNYKPDPSGDAETSAMSCNGITYCGFSTALYQPSTGPSNGALANTGDSAADFFLGSLATMSSNIRERVIHYADQELDAYIQDNYHVRRDLTLNLGLRYEDHPAMTSGGVWATTDFAHHAMVLKNTPAWYIANGWTTQSIITAYNNAGANFETPAQAGFPSKLLRNYPLNFAPRVGFAYQPFGGKTGTVLRGSYGLYTFPEAMRNTDFGRTAPFIVGFSYQNNNVANSPDGVVNYAIRNPQNIFMGVNTPSSIIPTTGTNYITPGSIGGGPSPDFPPMRVTEVNVSVEQSFKDQSALRVTYNYTHAANLLHNFGANVALSPFVYAYDYGTLPPSGGPSTAGTCAYTNTGSNPWDCKWFGGSFMGVRTGWSTDNSLQVNYQRLYHHGMAYQISYTWSRPFRIGGNSSRESTTYTLADYPGVMGTAPGISYAPPAGGSPITTPAAPPAAPKGWDITTEYKDLRRFQDYKVDPYFAIPFHHIWINGIYDLPVGRGKWLLGNSNRFVDELVGGWQIAGVGQVVSQAFAPGSSHWGPTSKLVTYKHNYPIVDCSSGKCFNRFMWFNGYISPKFLTAGNGGNCTTNCVTGLPANYVPYEVPINNDPTQANFGTDNVVMTGPNLNGGKPWTTPFAPDSSQNFAGNNPFSHSIVHGPFNYEADLSVFKVFPITEKTNIRVNVDAFNAFNIQGYKNPDGNSGEESIMPGGVDNTQSYWTARQLQLTMRFTW